ncbi:SOS-response transcriptional repressor LexA (RecA-mediated autopeptidase) [Roseibium suaedae]|uniref:SOS-response transcriptional repressor LexA (RecA-mediated autopeptidase) n=2 Tax=Roseibium suaedae TaxID=735517 RepID=A0A1M7D6L0_9HYPH|nr:SOS-response transcriptional repressor LexA (RecA-mediated autopeptidase) [Roseibium suaedae]
MEWNERIVRLRKDRGYSRAELARRSGVSYDNLNKYERGEVEKPRGNILELIAAALDTTEQELLYGTDFSPAQKAKAGLAIRGEVAAGIWLEADLFEAEAVETSTLVGHDIRHPSSAQYLLRIKGESLNKIAQDGDLILCVNYLDAHIEPKIGDLAVVERSRDGGHTIERTAKRIAQHNGVVELRPESTDPRFQTAIVYSDVDSESAEVTIKAKILGIFNQLD